MSTTPTTPSTSTSFGSASSIFPGTTPLSEVSTPGSGGSRDHYKETTPCCDHNNWDNVRVSKRVMTLRCRECQRQWRAHVETVWDVLKCPAYSGEGTCEAGCAKLHINYRKQNLEARFKVHGESVIDHVRVGRAQQDVQEKVDTLRKVVQGGIDAALLEEGPYEYHSPRAEGICLLDRLHCLIQTELQRTKEHSIECSQ